MTCLHVLIDIPTISKATAWETPSKTQWPMGWSRSYWQHCHAEQKVDWLQNISQINSMTLQKAPTTHSTRHGSVYSKWWMSYASWEENMVWNLCMLMPYISQTSQELRRMMDRIWWLWLPSTSLHYSWHSGHAWCQYFCWMTILQ